MSVYVSIGRNIGGTPMPLERWRRFMDDTEAAVLRYAGPIVSVTEGKGYYEGNAEHCAVFVGASDKPVLHNLALLKLRLRELCHTYEQECIAITLGHPLFVGP